MTLECRSDKEDRFDELLRRFDKLKQDMEEFAAARKQYHRNIMDRMDRISDLMDTSLRWTVGTISLFGTLVLIAMTVFKFVG